MINNQMKSYKLYVREAGYDEYGQPASSFIYSKTVDVAINNKEYKVNEKDIRYVEATHIGLTQDKTLSTDMKLVDGDTAYMIRYTNNFGRLAQLSLQEV